MFLLCKIQILSSNPQVIPDSEASDSHFNSFTHNEDLKPWNCNYNHRVPIAKLEDHIGIGYELDQTVYSSTAKACMRLP